MKMLTKKSGGKGGQIFLLFSNLKNKTIKQTKKFLENKYCFFFHKNLFLDKLELLF